MARKNRLSNRIVFEYLIVEPSLLKIFLLFILKAFSPKTSVDNTGKSII